MKLAELLPLKVNSATENLLHGEGTRQQRHDEVDLSVYYMVSRSYQLIIQFLPDSIAN